MSGILLRIVKTYGEVRPEMAAGCPEKLDPEFIRYVWAYRRQQRPKQLEFFKGMRPDQTFIRFARRREADDYLASQAPGLSAAGV